MLEERLGNEPQQSYYATIQICIHTYTLGKEANCIGCAMIRLTHFQTFPLLIIQGVQSQNLGDQAWEHGWVNPRNRYYTLNYIHRIHACTHVYMYVSSIQQAYTCTCTVVHTTSTFSPPPLPSHTYTPHIYTNRWWETADVVLWLPLLLVLYSGTAHCMYMYTKLQCTDTDTHVEVWML